MATITKGGTLPATNCTRQNIYDMLENSTITNIVNADISGSAAIADSKLATISTAGKVNTDALTTDSQAAGDVMYHNGTKWTRLAKGTATQALKMNSGATAPEWAADTGKILQVVSTQTGASTTGTTAIPNDDTTPQNTEGDEYMTLAVTPNDTNNKLLIIVTLQGGNSASSDFTVALFQDSTANALACMNTLDDGTGVYGCHTFSHYMTAGTGSETTFKVRAGASTGATTTFNGQAGSAKANGTIASSITIIEISA